ncbi:hypothetical protein F3F96_03195 [Mariprofundus sp. NF]|uniref:B-box zinc finger protein n=1 Tax=Mariprofundus sp. NF TaxID=2608716 RepID=UPI0015A45869|nr:B-box zinc finger protein [Mariprofundus sp. NF]NWF38142.1 hypothetical protein [Mariprofundus sp. NF]
MKEKSAAESKRCPLVLKKKDGSTTNIYCDDHLESRSTFKCLKCGHFFCEECVGGEDHDKTYCVSCKSFYVQDEKKRQAQMKKATDAVSSSKKVELTLSALGFSLIIALGYYVYVNSPAPVVQRSNLSPEEAKMVQAANRLVTETGLLVQQEILESKRLLEEPLDAARVSDE